MVNKNYTYLNTPDTFISQTLRNLILFLRHPVDFLLTYGDSLEKIPELQEVNEDAHNLGQKLLIEMKREVSGGMKAYFVGSNFFKIPGINNDIDLLAEYSTEEEREKWEKILVELFGKPVLKKHKFTKWEFVRNGFNVEVLLSHPKFRIFKKLFDAYNSLLDPEILTQYEELKRNSVGVTQREYNRRQLFFFDCLIETKLLFKKYIVYPWTKVMGAKFAGSETKKMNRSSRKVVETTVNSVILFRIVYSEIWVNSEMSNFFYSFSNLGLI